MNRILIQALTICIVISFQSIALADPPAKDVNIVNTPSVNVANTPTVNAQQSGGWNVNITGVPGVTIENGQSEPVPVEIQNNATKGRLVNISFSGIFQNASLYLDPIGYSAAPTIYTVPSGKEFIIQYISCSPMATSLGSTFSLSFITHLYTTPQENSHLSSDIGPIETIYPIMMKKLYSTSQYDYYAASQPMLAVVGGNTSSGTLELFGSRTNGSAGQVIVHCALTGELKNL